MSTPRHRRRVATAAVAVAALGSLAVVTGPANTASAAVAFGTSVLVSSDRVSEPGIDIAPDGTLYINGPTGLLSNLPGSPSAVYRSDDQGGSWARLPDGLKANLPGGGDSDIAISPDGTLSETDLWLGSSTVSMSRDKGETWTASPVQGVVVQDRQWVAASSGGRVYHVTHQIPSGLVVSTSVDYGLTFPVSTVAASVVDQTGCICPPGNLVAEAGGLLADRVGGVYATSTGGVGFYRSTNGGLTFANTYPGPASNADTSSAFPAVADAGNGRLAVVWLAVESGRSRVMFTSSNDFGATWAPPQAIVTAGTSVYPWVDYRNGKVAVSLYHSDASATPDTTPSGAPWYVSYLESADGGATWSGLVNADPTPVKTEPICTGGTSCSSNRELGDFQQVALDAAGHALISYNRSPYNDDRTEVRFVKEA